MIIIGEKILLRAIEPSDNQMLLDLINDPETEQMLGGHSWPISKEEQMAWYTQHKKNDSILRCIIARKEDNRPLGTIILNEINYKNGTGHIHIKMAKENARGKGYATDAVLTLVNYAFKELRLNCVFANILLHNQASIGLFEKCGFQREGILRARVFKQGKYLDICSYSKLSLD